MIGGTVGTFLATKLHADKRQVDLAGRSKVAALPDELLIQERLYPTPPRLTELPEDASYEWVVLATKLHHLRDVLEAMQTVRLKAKNVLSVQNGLVDNGQTPHVISAFDGFRLDGNRLLTTNTGRGWMVEDTPVGRSFTEMLTHAGILCQTKRGLERVRAEKSIVNSCLNGLSAIHNKTFAELFADPELVAQIERLFKECYAVLSTQFRLGPAEVIKHRLFRDWRYADHYSSTWQDHTAGKPTEIDFLNGYIVRLGQERGLKVSENMKIIDALTSTR